MGWVDRKYFPDHPGDICSGWYEAPKGVEPKWEYKDPDFHGTRDHRPIWVMVNGREIPDNLIAMTSGGADCRIVPYGKNPPYTLSCTVAAYFCYSHRIFLYNEDDVLKHFRGNKSIFGQWLKDQGIKREAPKKEVPEVKVPEVIAEEITAFLRPIIMSDMKLVGLWRAGKTGPLIGAAMREAKGKFDGKHVEKVLRFLIDGRPL